MTRNADNERTVGGLLGRAVGKAKAAAGALTANDELAREGRLQQAQGEAGIAAAAAGREADVTQAEADTRRQEAENDIERQHLENEVAGELSRRRIEEDRRSADSAAAQRAQAERAEAERKREAERTRAEQSVHQAEQAQVGATREALDLERAARQAEQRADDIDPKEHS